jgi:hypothetical protein
MEAVMNARFTITAAAALMLAATATAQPADTPAAPASRPSSPPAPVMLASADHLANPASGDAVQVPMKQPRAARITTCRCGGDPQPQVQDQGQE